MLGKQIKKYNYYDVCLIAKYEGAREDQEWYYTAETTERVQELVNWAIEHNLEIKYVKGRVR